MSGRRRTNIGVRDFIVPPRVVFLTLIHAHCDLPAVPGDKSSVARHNPPSLLR